MIIANTEYDIKNKRRQGYYDSQILAKDRNHLNKIIKKRNLKEQIWTTNLTAKPRCVGLSNLIMHDTVIRALHEAVYLTFLAASSKTLDIENSLGDEGIVHELVHILVVAKLHNTPHLTNRLYYHPDDIKFWVEFNIHDEYQYNEFIKDLCKKAVDLENSVPGHISQVKYEQLDYQRLLG